MDVTFTELVIPVPTTLSVIFQASTRIFVIFLLWSVKHETEQNKTKRHGIVTRRIIIIIRNSNISETMTTMAKTTFTIDRSPRLPPCLLLIVMGIFGVVGATDTRGGLIRNTLRGRGKVAPVRHETKKISVKCICVVLWPNLSHCLVPHYGVSDQTLVLSFRSVSNPFGYPKTFARTATKRKTNPYHQRTRRR